MLPRHTNSILYCLRFLLIKSFSDYKNTKENLSTKKNRDMPYTSSRCGTYPYYISEMSYSDIALLLILPENIVNQHSHIGHVGFAAAVEVGVAIGGGAKYHIHESGHIGHVYLAVLVKVAKEASG